MIDGGMVEEDTNCGCYDKETIDTSAFSDRSNGPGQLLFRTDNSRAAERRVWHAGGSN